MGLRQKIAQLRGRVEQLAPPSAPVPVEPMPPLPEGMLRAMLEASFALNQVPRHGGTPGVRIYTEEEQREAGAAAALRWLETATPEEHAQWEAYGAWADRQRAAPAAPVAAPAPRRQR